jgi:hypothetical protein
MACEIPSNLNGMNKMYNHLGWIFFKGYGKKSRKYIYIYIYILLPIQQI